MRTGAGGTWSVITCIHQNRGHGSPGIFVTPVMLNAQSLQVQETYLFMKLQSNLTVDYLLSGPGGVLYVYIYKWLHDVVTK